MGKVSTKAVALVSMEIELGGEYGDKWTFREIQADAKSQVGNRLLKMQAEHPDLRKVQVISIKAVSVEERE
ncbi:hypothetical protein CIW54_07495 [Paraburkholderia sp. T12-10]|nr:hypothetical protein CIW54_07495 [Paraburkholderia sp. T12-10]